MNKYKIAAIVVTYNRLELLKNCLVSIEQQTRKPDALFIVDNASSDGTNDFLKEYKTTYPVHIVTLKENMGGAGGFHSGLKEAYETNLFDAFWIMDDDGIPDKDCLNNLELHLDKMSFVAPLVLSIENKEDLAFPYLKQTTYREVIDSYPEGIIHKYANPFNGILLSKILVKKIGYPKEDMFIWGDEVEYLCRAIKNKFIPHTITKAIHYHPKDRLKKKAFINGNHSIIFTDSKLRNYCKYRNTTYVCKKYGKTGSSIKYLFKYLVFFLLQKLDIKNTILFTRAFIDGYSENFTRHNKYM